MKFFGYVLAAAFLSAGYSSGAFADGELEITGKIGILNSNGKSNIIFDTDSVEGKPGFAKVFILGLTPEATKTCEKFLLIRKVIGAGSSIYVVNFESEKKSPGVRPNGDVWTVNANANTSCAIY